MMKFTVLVIALVLAPSIHSSAVDRNLINTYPLIINPAIPETRPLPLPIPEVEGVAPETKPLPLPEVGTVPELRPLPVPESPCDVCFGYMSSLIEQLTETVAGPSLPEFVPEGPEFVPGVPEFVPGVPEFVPEGPIIPGVIPQPIEPSLPGAPEILPVPEPAPVLPVIRPLPFITNF
ncbi:hypothetical protein NQ314_010347 [Rhamnusium bicolor]|uniref:Uncharacterized protein n=1 Tax=Rhamnusium bicolor TaxID=1586634 RepID=A0AAV8XRA6_9CUCU|nr:hypothetical protein NQ314_010347 [Rhamnusium bicolor]